jgi:dihydroorotase
LTPPVTTTDMAITYKEKLERLEPKVNFLMTLYLSPQLTVEEVEKAKAAGIIGTNTCNLQLTLGVKSYPKYSFQLVVLISGA